ncbi:MAG TPA: anti-sigma factor [Phenylobacterium sp.]|nr:anti-sigma factor [Phenylobacterium sp.]
MSPCPEREPMLQALLDGELDAANALAEEAHLKTCAGCAAHYRTLQALHERLAEADLATPAPAGLRARIEAAIEREGRAAAPAHRRRPWWARVGAAWSVAGAMGVVVASLLVIQVAPMQVALEDQLVASHVRSLQANHLIDVATSDRHVVRPWFNGKIDFAPPVPDLTDQGFPLAGGRLDYADGRTVAAVVYRRRAHVINLFVMPHRAAAWSLARPRTPPGYSVVTWTRGGLDYWAVSDVEGAELEAFHKAFEARAG